MFLSCEAQRDFPASSSAPNLQLPGAVGIPRSPCSPSRAHADFLGGNTEGRACLPLTGVLRETSRAGTISLLAARSWPGAAATAGLWAACRPEFPTPPVQKPSTCQKQEWESKNSPFWLCHWGIYVLQCRRGVFVLTLLNGWLWPRTWVLAVAAEDLQGLSVEHVQGARRMGCTGV